MYHYAFMLVYCRPKENFSSKKKGKFPQNATKTAKFPFYIIYYNAKKGKSKAKIQNFFKHVKKFDFSDEKIYSVNRPKKIDCYR